MRTFLPFARIASRCATFPAGVAPAIQSSMPSFWPAHGPGGEHLLIGASPAGRKCEDGQLLRPPRDELRPQSEEPPRSDRHLAAMRIVYSVPDPHRPILRGRDGYVLGHELLQSRAPVFDDVLDPGQFFNPGTGGGLDDGAGQRMRTALRKCRGECRSAGSTSAAFIRIGSPVVRVPVLSKTTASISDSLSSASVLEQHPLSKQSSRGCSQMAGTARPSAQGQVMMRTAAAMFTAMRQSPARKPQPRNAAIASTLTMWL